MLLSVLRRRSRCCYYSVWLCGLYYGELHVYSCLALCPRISSVLLALWSPRLGKREVVYVLLVHLFVYFARVNLAFFRFLLVSVIGCGVWLWHSLDFLLTFLKNLIPLLSHIRAYKANNTRSFLSTHYCLLNKTSLKAYFVCPVSV